MPNPYVLVGAMVAGPYKDDDFIDERINYTCTEPTIAGNAGLVAALVALSGEGTSGLDKNTIFYSVLPISPIQTQSLDTIDAFLLISFCQIDKMACGFMNLWNSIVYPVIF